MNVRERYDIGGMHCAACSAAVERVVKKLEGVAFCEVNLLLSSMTVSYESELCNPEKIIAKVEKAGFTAALHIEEKAKDKSLIEKENEAKKGRTPLIVSLILTGMLMYISMGQMLFVGIPIPSFLSMAKSPYGFALAQLATARRNVRLRMRRPMFARYAAMSTRVRCPRTSVALCATFRKNFLLKNK